MRGAGEQAKGPLDYPPTPSGPPDEEEPAWSPSVGSGALLPGNVEEEGRRGGLNLSTITLGPTGEHSFCVFTQTLSCDFGVAMRGSQRRLLSIWFSFRSVFLNPNYCRVLLWVIFMRYVLNIKVAKLDIHTFSKASSKPIALKALFFITSLFTSTCNTFAITHVIFGPITGRGRYQKQKDKRTSKEPESLSCKMSFCPEDSTLYDI